jgi:succinate dehydrogenase/fumarate reductase flavoprotein subunit
MPHGHYCSSSGGLHISRSGSKCVPTFMKTPLRVAPSSHYTVGGLKVDMDGRTSHPNVYAAGQVAGACMAPTVTAAPCSSMP